MGDCNRGTCLWADSGASVGAVGFARCLQERNDDLGFNFVRLPSAPVQNPFLPVDSALDLEVILHGTPPEVRLALLLRHSRTRWSEVAEIVGTSEASIRVRCQRALKKIRRGLGIGENGT